jgi:FAD/FMN-containing dehydrogenase
MCRKRIARRWEACWPRTPVVRYVLDSVPRADYVIGIRAIDGRGESFAGGGRVVKNVAGYDFCKLLIGSLGTLGIITEVTLKLKPLAFGRCVLVSAPSSRDESERMLAGLMQATAQPVAIEWLAGPQWNEHAKELAWPVQSQQAGRGVGWLVLVLEGSAAEACLDDGRPAACVAARVCGFGGTDSAG